MSGFSRVDSQAAWRDDVSARAPLQKRSYVTARHQC